MENTENNPFLVKRNEKLISIKTIFFFLFRGILRLFLLFCTIFFIWLSGFFIDNHPTFNKFSYIILMRLCLYFIGFKDISIDNNSKKLLQENKSQIIVVNHSSYIDILLIAYLFPDSVFVASKFIKEIPLIKKWTNNKCIFFTEMFGGKNINKLIDKSLNEGKKIVFFSEGCCSRSDILLKLRKGAFIWGKSICPVHIKYDNDLNWVMGEDSVLSHFIYLLSNSKNNISVKILDEYIPSEEEKKNVNKFNENFREYYAKNTGVLLSDLSYKDHPYYKEKIISENVKS